MNTRLRSKRSRDVHIRFSDEEYGLLEEHAKGEGLDLSSAIRRLVRKAMPLQMSLPTTG